uniref:Gypsy retrotransposon integrase-like protein 1 n=1 Tax=Xenopus tropicalis TaxID=8364 RepID=A0A803KB09_XENTR
MEQFKPPNALIFSGNLSENWRRWEQKLQLYLTATGACKYPEAQKIAILLHTIGEEGLELYNTMNVVYGTPEAPTMNELLAQFRKHCNPRKNSVFERYQFWTHPMPDTGGIDKFQTELKLKAKDCEFKDTEDLMLRDKIVFSITNPALKEKLLADPDLTLEKAVSICRIKETTKAQVEAMGASAAERQMQALSQRKASKEYAQDRKSGHIKQSMQKSPDTQVYSCKQCGQRHKPKQCSAYGATCHKCNGKNNFAKCCRTKNPLWKMNKEKPKEIDSLFIGVLQAADLCTQAQKLDDAWYTDITIGENTVKFKLDTGAEANVLPIATVNTMSTPVKIEPTTTVLVSYGGTKLIPRGCTTLAVMAKGQQAKLQFFITNENTTPILGRKACVDLQLIQRIDTVNVSSPATKKDLITKHPEVFKGLGCFPGKHHIYVDPTVPPVIHGCRKIPYAIMDKFKQTLTELKETGVVSLVTVPTPWVNSLVITEKKNGNLRVCLDPRDLNKAIKRQHYSISTPEDVRSKLNGKKFFTILDEKDGYWQVVLDEKSSLLCTFNTPWGRYKFNRLPFGIKSASEVFQQKNSEAFGDIEGTHIIADDMIIAASTKQEHDDILNKVMERARKLNVKFNKDKIQYLVKEVKYMGHIISSDGVKPDDSKISAILNMPPPQDKKGLMRFLGMTRYLAQYIPKEASLTAPLRMLLKKDILWQWGPEQDKALNLLKSSLTQAPVLSYFDPAKQLEIQADASKDGLGACLMQERKPIVYVSRALSRAEQNYAQIEKELLAIVFATKKFHQYIYGANVKVQSDHKPLQAILSRPIGQAPARLQRMLLQLQKYDISVSYTPGKLMAIADTLSRAVDIKSTDNGEELFDEKVVYAMQSTEALSPKLLQMLKVETQKDDTLQAVKDMHTQGWPQRKKQVPSIIHQYWPIRHTFSIVDDLLMSGDRVVIPKGSRAEMLRRLHSAHQGMQRSKARARLIMCWPGMSKDIEQMVENCTVCQEERPANHKETLLSHDIPDLPWLKLAADIFDFRGHAFLLIVDYFSKYPEILKLPDKTSHSIIAKLKSVFARHGIPKEMVSDNMPFSSREIHSFASQWGIQLTHSSPGYPQSNGQAERMIQTVKLLFKKSFSTGADPHLALLHLRNTPISGTNVTPAQLLMGRVLRSTLPETTEILKPKLPEKAHKMLLKLQNSQRQYYNRGAKDLPIFQKGERVRIQTSQGWKPAVIVKPTAEPRSYMVMTPGGARFRRNRRHLRRDTIIPTAEDEVHLPADMNNESGVDPVESPEQRAVPVDPRVDEPTPAAHQPTGEQRSTRFGRTVIKPAKLQDYVLS